MSEIDPTTPYQALPEAEPTTQPDGGPPEQIEKQVCKVEDHFAVYLQAELQEMAAAWTRLVQEAPFCPCWTWREVQEALLDLTETPVEELVIRGALSGLVKQAKFKPQELILAELIRLIRAGHDLVLQRSARAMLEAEMP